MRSIESLKEEIESVKGSASLMKWLGILNAIGSVGLGIWLLLFHVEQPLSSITTGLDTVVGSGFTNSSFLIAMAFVGWAFVGFESAGSIAEEVKEEIENLFAKL